MENHVKEQTSKCKQIILQLNQCCSLSWGLKKSILKQIWIGVIQPILLYGCPSWIRELCSAQRLMAIKMIKGFRNISFEASIILAGLQPITYSVRKTALMYATKHPDHYLSAKIIRPGVHLFHIEKKH